MSATSYRVEVTREDDLWVAVVDGLPAGATDVERFGELDTEVRDLVAGLTDVDPGDLTLDWRYVHGDVEYTPVLRELARCDGQVADAVRQRDEARRSAITTLRGLELSYRDIADVVGLSHQRVAQLAQEYARPTS